jgi:UDP-N-acetylglucosamine 2-epimerase (non-hydrolysing)
MDGFLGADGLDTPTPLGRRGSPAGKPKLLVVLGTRPEAIKLAPVVAELTAQGVFEVAVCNTGQHRDMVAPICRLFSIPMRYDLGVMRPAQDLAYLAGAVTQQLGEVIALEQPAACIVQGDTTTAMAGALAGFYRRVPVAHVEAGLRTGDMREPWPEEANRVLITRLSRLHFAPTPAAAATLIGEGVDPEQVHMTGNTVVDAAVRMRRLVKDRPPSRLAQLNGDDPVVLFTMHRRESFGEPMRRVFRAMRRFAAENPVQVVFPVHPNPEVKGAAEAILGGLPNVRLLPPLDYDEMIHLLDRCRFVVTNSGGLIEEAPSFHKPVLIVRQATERPEAVACGAAALVGYEDDALLELAETLAFDSPLYRTMAAAPNPFGDGQAALRIARILTEAFVRGVIGGAEWAPVGRLM